MGFGIWQLLVILLIVVLLFGTKRLRNLGADLGGGVKGLRKMLGSEDEPAAQPSSARTDESAQRRNH